MNKHKGFTLIEIAIVLVIIGLLIGGVLKGLTVLQSASDKDVIAAVRDVQAATLAFKAQYGFLPGDLPTATTSIAGMGPAPICTANGNGNGAIDTAVERNCARDELILSGFIRGTPGSNLIAGTSIITVSNRTQALASVPGIPANWVNVVVVSNLNCDFAIQMARSTGDANPQGTTFWTSVNTCIGQDASIAVPFAVLRIN